MNIIFRFCPISGKRHFKNIPVCFQLCCALCFEDRAVWIQDFSKCVIASVHNADSPCVFEFWTTNALREVSMQMFVSQHWCRRKVSGRHVGPRWCPLNGHQHGVSILWGIQFANNSSTGHRIVLKLWQAIQLLLFYNTWISWLFFIE